MLEPCTLSLRLVGSIRKWRRKPWDLSVRSALHDPIGPHLYSPRFDINVSIDWAMFYALRNQGVWLPCVPDIPAYPMTELHTRGNCNLNATHWHIEFEEAFL